MKLRYPHYPLSSLSLNQSLIASAVLATLAVPAAAQGPLQFQELPRMGLPLDSADTASIALGDVDGDGDLDMLLGNFGQNRLYLNRGAGSFSDATASRMPGDIDRTNSVALGDVDGDGDLDMVIGNGRVRYPPSGGQNRLYLNDGSGRFSDATASQMPVDGDPTAAVTLGDIDGDGDLDLVIGNRLFGYPLSSGQSRLYRNDGTGTFTDVTANQMPAVTTSANSVALGDVDGDGDLDIVLAVTPAFSQLYLNDSTGTFTDVTASQMPGGPGGTTGAHNNTTNSVALGDVDGDGDLDMVLGNSGSSYGYANNLYLNDGTGTFSGGFGPGLTAVSVALGDLDGDGDLDMVVAPEIGRTGGPQKELYLNAGSGSFTDVTRSRMPADADRTLSMALGDVDGDGDLDMAFGNSGYFWGPQNRLYLNLQRQLHAPTAPQIGQPYTLDASLRYGPPSTVSLAAVYLSTGSVSILLPPYGTLGIDLAMAASSPTLIIPQPAGVGTASFPVPNAPSLIGQEIYSQAVLVAVPNDLRLSNVVRDVIQ